MSDTQTMTKTDALLDACKGKGATVEQIMEVTGQTRQVVTSRIFSLRKAGRLTAVEDSKPRRYKRVPKAKA